MGCWVKYLNTEDIEEVNWTKLRDIYDKSVKRLKNAIKEKVKEKQDKNIYEAITGNYYYDKYACMAGMLYLVDCWQENGIESIKKEFTLGYEDFINRILKKYDLKKEI